MFCCIAIMFAVGLMIGYFTVIVRSRVVYYLINSLRVAERRIGYRYVISYEIEKDNCIII